jgi:hypothetical protein
MTPDSPVLEERRRRGRPAKPADQIRREPINLRTTAELRETIEAAAQRSGRSLAGEIEHLVRLGLLMEQHLGRPSHGPILPKPAFEALTRAAGQFAALAKAMQPLLRPEMLAMLKTIGEASRAFSQIPKGALPQISKKE